MKRLMLSGLFAAATLVAASAAVAQDYKERTIKFGTQNAAGHPIVVGMDKFKEIVESKSKGKIKVNVFPAAQLGNDQFHVSGVQGGTIEMSVMNSGILASQVPAFAIFDFPFIFVNEKEADAVVDGPFGKKMHTRLEEKGIVGLGYWELGFRNMTNSKRPLNKVEDIAGLKIRVIPNPINLDWVRALDANPTPLPFPELYGALENKAVDGQENPIPTIKTNKFAEVQKHLAITKHVYNPQSVMFSKKVWDTMTADEKKLFIDATAEAGLMQRKLSREAVSKDLEELKKAGMQVTEFSPAETLKFVDRVKPVITKYAANVGSEVVNELFGELVKLRK
ncbi:MAG: TRAP transporter substrate-binding protein [Betaproteobacteria bacterium]|nr:MAG: TRAP transporter substrate-binding protein [Betaproteobacteria bacterium]